jgi:hypothetical protein
MESYAIEILFSGLAIAALAWIWLLIRAFRHSIWWGLGSLLLPPLAFAFSLRQPQKTIGPLVLFILGGLAVASPLSYSLVSPVDLGLRAKLQDGPKLWSLASRALQSDAAHEWMASRAFYMQLSGLAVALFAWFWLLVRAFRLNRKWGLGSLVLPPVGLVFVGRHPRKGIAPLLLCVLSLVVAAAPAVYTLCVRLDLGPRDKLVDGQRHLTLTGWDRKDYSVLRLEPQKIALLQMANPDVTDETLESLKEMKALQELDLNNTQVTDEGLKILNGLPSLTRLRLAHTKISDQGFHDLLSAKESLMQLDLSGTPVSRETAKAWRDAKSGRRVLQ